MKKAIVLFAIFAMILSCEMGTLEDPSLNNSVDAKAAGAVSVTLTETNLKVAQDYTLFILGDLEQQWTDSLGRIAAAGDINVRGYGVALNRSDLTDEYAMVAGGSISHMDGTVYHGNVAYGEEYNGERVTIMDGTAEKASPIDFEEAEVALKELSSKLADREANGEVVNEWGKIIFRGTDAKANVFTIEADELGSSHTIDVDIPEGSAAVINVLGDSAMIQGKGFTGNMNGRKQNILFNFPEAEELTVQSVGFKGSILAPYAAMTFNWCHIDGTIVAASLTGSGESHYFPFIPFETEEEEIPVPPSFDIKCIKEISRTDDAILYVIYAYGMDEVSEILLNDCSCEIIDRQSYYATITVDVDKVKIGENNSVGFKFTNGAFYVHQEGLDIE